MVLGVTDKEQRIIEDILDAYADSYAFYYYGSRVKGNFEKTSDLDVLIKGQKEMPLFILSELKEKFDASYLPYIVNFSDYHNITPDFYEHIKQDLVNYKANA
ncbi:MAG: nucleotidyltransferase family protein [Alphaproteobacteria bacterium]|nr:nucleotidyltransferase domain-containing protein [Alphaproteobacteria bacterium]MDY4690208.1 nucleotidyltransferase domain-containing protein [Alphaproteobacteria bacterium]